MQRVTTIKISKLLMAPALISLLVGCGTPQQSTVEKISLSQPTSESSQVLAANNNVMMDTNNIDPMMISDMQKANRATGTQTFDGENQTTDNWVVFDNTPAGASVKNVDLDGNNVIYLDGEGIKNGFALRQTDGSYLNNTDATV